MNVLGVGELHRLVKRPSVDSGIHLGSSQGDAVASTRTVNPKPVSSSGAASRLSRSVSFAFSDRKYIRKCLLLEESQKVAHKISILVGYCLTSLLESVNGNGSGVHSILDIWKFPFSDVQDFL